MYKYCYILNNFVDIVQLLSVHPIFYLLLVSLIKVINELISHLLLCLPCYLSNGAGAPEVQLLPHEALPLFASCLFLI